MEPPWLCVLEHGILRCLWAIPKHHAPCHGIVLCIRMILIIFAVHLLSYVLYELLDSAKVTNMFLLCKFRSNKFATFLMAFVLRHFLYPRVGRFG